MGVFTNAINLMAGRIAPATPARRRSLSGWLLERLHRSSIQKQRLTLVERINLAPRQTLVLIEADGERLLVATSPDGSPAFYPLRGAATRRAGRSTKSAERKGE
ncbi:MAG TPA: flagellar biosynthetic protein FliO [Terracidiphilus sp.]